MSDDPKLPDVHFGEVKEDERLPPAPDDHDADDDEELDETPADVIELLGFDPLEDDEE